MSSSKPSSAPKAAKANSAPTKSKPTYPWSTPASTKLATLPVIREVALRRGANFTGNSVIGQESFLAQAAGIRNKPACRSCAKGAGPFAKCVSVEGFFKGSCANCHYQFKACSLQSASTSSTTTAEFPELYPVPATPPRPRPRATKPLPRPAAPKSKPQVAASAPGPSGSGSSSSSSSGSPDPTSSSRKRKRVDEDDVDLTEARRFRRKILRVAEAAEKLSDSMYEWADRHALENGLDLETGGESSEDEFFDSTSDLRH
ncbi:hypothetical protein VTN00DRAFT_5826 [Thermoascus crustaceus]|uniref:uncharacterized protein n=1 Tax=Thermoascus crustaceus TaxID=5088 RepID=UPI0037424443